MNDETGVYWLQAHPKSLAVWLVKLTNGKPELLNAAATVYAFAYGISLRG